MLYLATIFHMHQPYYKNILTQETPVPWVRLHGIKDYLDMVQILENYPLIHQTFNLVPSLLEQVEDYVKGTVKDKFLELSYKPAASLNPEEKHFILENFFMINRERVIAVFPRYYELFLKKQAKKEFTLQDYLDLQVWFNLAWTDPSFRENIPELKKAGRKARFFTEEDKRAVLDKQAEILKGIIPAYKKMIASGQVEVTISPYYHPILPLLYHTKSALEADPKATIPKINFNYPQDAKAQVDLAVSFFKERFGAMPTGMWPSEESVSEHILPFIIQSGIQWIVTDEALLFKSLKKKRRDTRLLYQPHLLKRKDGSLNIIFRDRNLSDLIGFVYHRTKTESAVEDFIGHLKNIAAAFKKEDVLVCIALDGENAWEYYPNDGHDFLNLLYQRLSEADFLKCVTIKEYLKEHKPTNQIRHLATGSWIFANFSKWINNPYKNLAWEYLAIARKELEEFEANAHNPQPITQNPKPITQHLTPKTQNPSPNTQLAWKQIYIAEGSDWFWWYGDDQADFDNLFRMHLSNFYTIIQKPIPDYLKKPLQP